MCIIGSLRYPHHIFVQFQYVDHHPTTYRDTQLPFANLLEYADHHRLRS